MIDNTSVVNSLDGSDHNAVQFVVKLCGTRANQPKRHVYNFKKADFIYFRDHIASISWESTQMDDSIEENWQKWKDTLNAAVGQCIPRAPWNSDDSKPRKANESKTILELVKENQEE